MRKFLWTIAIAALLLPLSLRAQDTTWYSGGWHPIPNAEKAAYFRTRTKTDSGWQVIDHYLNGKTQMTGTYADDSLHVRQGVFRWYNDKGTITHLYSYFDGKAKGLEVVYYESGQEQMKGNNIANQKQGAWVGFYPSGKPAGKAFYQAGKQISVGLYKENGTLNKADTIFQRDAEYPGGIPQYLRFMNKTLRYPDSAQVYEIEGTVLVRFKITKDGKVADLQIAQSTNKYLDEEALRVMALMPDWQPEIAAGIRIDSYHLQPVVFNLGRK